MIGRSGALEARGAPGLGGALGTGRRLGGALGLFGGAGSAEVSAEVSVPAGASGPVGASGLPSRWAAASRAPSTITASTTRKSRAATSPEPTPTARACGAVSERLTAAWARPISWGGVAAWAAVARPTMAAGMPAPAITRPAATTGRDGASRSTVPRPNTTDPAMTVRRGPSRPISRPPTTEPPSAPTASVVSSTPRNCGGRCSPCWVSANSTGWSRLSTKPVTAVAATSGRSPVAPRRWAKPASTSVRHRRPEGSGLGSSARRPRKARAASSSTPRSASATACPPSQL